jgi:hypothetical protein
MWAQALIQELGVSLKENPSLWCGHIGVTYFSSNHVFSCLDKEN